VDAVWILVAIGAIFVVGGGVLVVFGVRHYNRFREVTQTPTIGVAQAALKATREGFNRVEVFSPVEVEEPLESPVREIPCVYYRRLVEKERSDSEGGSYYSTVLDEKEHSPFYLSDISGVIKVIPEGAEFVAKRALRSMGDFGASVPMTGSEYLGYAVSEKVGDFFHSVGRSGYRTTEWVVPADGEVYVLGNVYRTMEGAEIKKGKGPFIIGYQPARELARRFMWRTAGFLAGGLVAVAVGVFFVVYGLTLK
jgi:hypothetical protein